MDTRWPAPQINEAQGYRVYLHKTASIDQVRTGVATDAFDMTPYCSDGTQGPFETELRFDYNNELNPPNQPIPGNVMEVQAYRQGTWQVLWVGVVDSIGTYTVAWGKKSMTVICRSRDSLDIWKYSQRVTREYPQGTNLTAIAVDVCAAVGLQNDEILVPTTGYTTAHSNTQMAGISGWQMLTVLFMAMGYTPFVNWGGQVTGASRTVTGRSPDIQVPESMLVRVDASRHYAPTTRVILQWLDPSLSKSAQQGRKLADATITCGFFVPFVQKDIWFSSDKTQRAEGTYMQVKQSANALFIPVALETWTQTSENDGNIKIISLGYTQALFALALAVKISAAIPDGVVVFGVGIGVEGSSGITIPNGKIAQGIAELALYLTMMSVGTGVYEIWGNPYNWVHARNTSEAYDISAAPWLDNPKTISNDFIMNEGHAQTTCIRELSYQAKAANNYRVVIVNDLRIEYGDILQFSDGTMIYVTDFKRPIGRGTSPELQVTGFML